MSHLILKEDRLFVSCMEGSVLAFEKSTGKDLWKTKTGGYCHSSPAFSEGKLVVGSADGSIYAFDANTGNSKPVALFTLPQRSRKDSR
jgi:outer membrane protein assembly factor BamB